MAPSGNIYKMCISSFRKEQTEFLNRAKIEWLVGFPKEGIDKNIIRVDF
jgi:hypothetical protein